MQDNNQNNNENQVQDINKLEKAKREKFDEMLKEGKNPFVITKYEQTHHSTEIKDNFDSLEDKEVSIAGRLMLNASIFIIYHNIIIFRCYFFSLLRNQKNNLFFLKIRRTKHNPPPLKSCHKQAHKYNSCIFSDYPV